MTPKLTTFFAAITILAGLAATTVLAQENAASTQPPPAHGTMGGHGGMMGMMGQMSPDQTKQMTSIVDNCNRMMEGMNHAPTSPEKEPTPGNDG
jgi:Spy/CpxP family protein refolding chaperone